MRPSVRTLRQSVRGVPVSARWRRAFHIAPRVVVPTLTSAFTKARPKCGVGRRRGIYRMCCGSFRGW